MVTETSPLAGRLLTAISGAHAALLAHTSAPEAVRSGLAAVYDALAAGVVGLNDDDLLATPSPDEWSMAEILDHVGEHDRVYDEARRLGVEHYVEHAIEHALQLWRLRAVVLNGEAHPSNGRGPVLPA